MKRTQAEACGESLHREIAEKEKRNGGSYDRFNAAAGG